MIPLSIGQFTAIDVDPVEFISIASRAGCQRVSLLTHWPRSQRELPVVTGDNFAAVHKALLTSGLAVGNAECFMIMPDTDVESFRQGLSLGAELGAVGATTLLYDVDEARVKSNLNQLCGMARDFGLRVSIEFMAMTPRWNTLTQAVALIQEIAQPNLGLCVDLLHLCRSGGTPGEVAAVPPALIHYAQLCDSADPGASRDYAAEAAGNRLAPGEGTFPIRAFLQSLPSTATLEIEVPQPPDQPAMDRVKAIVAASRRQIELAAASSGA